MNSCGRVMRSRSQRGGAVSERVGLLGMVKVGLAVVRYLERVGITERGQLVGQDPVELYDRLCVLDGQPYDLCLLDTFMSAVDQADGRPGRPWWDYTVERKRLIAERNVALSSATTRDPADVRTETA